ncbi:MAG: dihydropteroate synthase [Acidimicrobiales bacterium]|nr:dihydropteroate synthase [Acidimicrobiales bacterium]
MADHGASSPSRARLLVMGILNVTPDSFSDGGRYLDPDAAVARGVELFEEGADVVDVGGESTRPGAEPVPVDEELARVVPVIKELASRRLGRISVDTTKPEVARAAVEAGATLINDVSASLHGVAAEAGVGWIAMHRRGTPKTMQDDPRYDDVVAEVVEFLEQRARVGVAAGVDEIWLDPGIGFGKTVAHNLLLLRHVDRLADLGFPLVVGTSRKAFLGLLLQQADRADRPVPPGDRLEGSLATAVWAYLSGASMVRVHDVRATVQAVAVVGLPGRHHSEL